MVHIAFCDDSVSELSYMVELIELYSQEKRIECSYILYNNGLDLIADLQKHKSFDVFCLDIIMPGFSGIETAKEIRQHNKVAPILFFTSSREFAIWGYSVKAVNYLLKPVSRSSFFAAFDEVLELLQTDRKEHSLLVKSTEGLQKILLGNLAFAEVYGRTVLYHLRSGKIIKSTEPFAPLCDKLLAYGFFLKPHRSYIVNMQFIDTIDPQQITLQTGSVVPIAQGRVKEIKECYLNYQMEEV